MTRSRERRLLVLVVVVAAVYAVAAWWLLATYDVPPVSAVSGLLILVAVASQFGGKWAFGELFRDGIIRSGGRLAPFPAFRAALVGAGVSRLLPVGGAVTPVAMSWAIRNEARGTTGAAVRATTLNYAGLLVGTGLSLIWVDARGLAPEARPGIAIGGVVVAVVGAVLMVGSGRLATLSRFLPARWRSRLTGVLVDHSPGPRTQGVLWLRLLLEAAALFLVMLALGIDLTPTQTFVAFGVGQLFGGLPGTPGGLGFAEAGLVGALAAFGIPPATSIGPTIVYRVVSYWLPAGASLFAGGLTFLRAESAAGAAQHPGG